MPQHKLLLLLPRRCIYNHVKTIVTIEVFVAPLILYLQVYPKGLTYCRYLSTGLGITPTVKFVYRIIATSSLLLLLPNSSHHPLYRCLVDTDINKKRSTIIPRKQERQRVEGCERGRRLVWASHIFISAGHNNGATVRVGYVT